MNKKCRGEAQKLEIIKKKLRKLYGGINKLLNAKKRNVLSSKLRPEERVKVEKKMFFSVQRS